MRKLSRKALSIVMSIVLVVGLCPGLAYASENVGGEIAASDELAVVTSSDSSAGSNMNSYVELTTQGGTIATAASIPLNQATTGALASMHSEEWYRINLPSDGKMALLFDGDYRTAGGWDMWLYTADSQSVWSGTYMATNTVSKTVCTVGLLKGDYYIRVKNRSTTRSLDGVAYTLTPQFSPSEAWETELNNTIVTADAITMGTTYYGNLQENPSYDSQGVYHSNDEDWFKVSLAKRGSFAVLFQGDYHETGSYMIKLFNEGNEELTYSRHNASSTKASLVCASNLEPGTYYVRVANYGSRINENSSYSLTPYYVASTPTAVTGIVYNGQVQTGVQAQEGSILSGAVSAVDAGDYTATAKLQSAYIWSDASRSDLTIPWSITASGSGSFETAVPALTMHRLYNPNSGEHFYTSDEAEYADVVAAGWRDEGIGWTAPVTSNTPVFRMYNPNAGEHHYCVDEGERDMLVGAGWAYEGVGWYSDDAKAVPLYRDYNPNAFANNHNYTTSKEEHEWLLSLGWRDEGLAWYGV